MQKVLQTIQKSIGRRYKKYLQMIQGAYQKRRQSEIGSLRTQPLASWKVSFLFVERPFVCFLVYFLERPFVCFPRVFFLQPWQKWIYFSLPPPSSVPGGQAFIIVCSVIVWEKNKHSAFFVETSFLFHFYVVTVSFHSFGAKSLSAHL